MLFTPSATDPALKGPPSSIYRVEDYQSRASYRTSEDWATKSASSRQNSYTFIPVAIIGAGESGIAAACQLKEQVGGFDQFRVFERQASVGGTWWINRYPGVACDIPALFYSFSFAQNPYWSSSCPPGSEIFDYLNRVCSRYRIVDKIQLNTDVVSCVWLEDERVWELELRHLVQGMGDLSVKDRRKVIEEKGETAVFCGREVVRAKVVLSCVGGLVEPRGWPDQIPGEKRFQGSIFHSARWNYDVDLKDKDVVVVGTGCSAAQFVPLLTKSLGAKRVTQIMRSPPWVVKRASSGGKESTWDKWEPWLFAHVPGFQRALRTLMAAALEWSLRLFRNGEWNQKERAKVEAHLLKHMKRTVPEKYHDMLTPDYGIGCKRRIYDVHWFPSLQDERMELTTQPLTSVEEKTVTIGPGRTYPPMSNTESTAPTEQRAIPADVIILANGFEATRWLHPLQVTGRNGTDLVKEMDARGGPQAYLGTAMDGFPNFFLIFGPNTASGHTSAILATENMVGHALKFVKPILCGDVETVEVKKRAEMEYTRDIQASLKNTVWMSGGCSSYYFDHETRWNSTMYPYTQMWFTLRCMFPKYSDWDVRHTRKGLIKLFLWKGARALLLAVFLLGLWRARQADGWLAGLWAQTGLFLQQVVGPGRLVTGPWRRP
ncbi:hypothetical protein IWZ03DRAFT_386559 [Phyllosticta citriasiana]|uniref:Uncharacterized protein n=1 Tax=Phyllosticta citriasiana TaxID=595635 RepID=A0ABR1KBW8_9PEZI